MNSYTYNSAKYIVNNLGGCSSIVCNSCCLFDKRTHKCAVRALSLLEVRTSADVQNFKNKKLLLAREFIIEHADHYLEELL